MESKANVQRSFLQSKRDSLSGRMDNGFQVIFLPNALWVNLGNSLTCSFLTSWAGMVFSLHLWLNYLTFRGKELSSMIA